MLTNFSSDYAEYYLREYEFIKEIQVQSTNRYNLKTLSDYYFSLLRVKKDQEAAMKSYNLDMRICRIYKGMIEKTKQPEKWEKVKVDYLNDINGFMATIGDCYLNRAL